MGELDFEEKVNRTLEMLDESEAITEHNAQLIRDYHRDRMLNGIGDATQQKNLSYLKKVAEHVGEQPLDEMNKADIKDLMQWFHDRDLAESTIETYKEVTTLFWTWLNDGDEPDCVAWIERNGTTANDTLPKDLLTKQDVQNQIDAAKNPRDKAFIAMLYETGARIGELIDLTVGDIEDRKHGKKVVIEGKTGARRLPLVESVPHINAWLSKHPNPEKDNPLWCKIQQGDPDERLGYRYIRTRILEKNMDRADIDKPSNPHHYRHSRASHLATELKEAQLCEWFGWVQGSDVPARYVHLSGRDMDNAYDQMHGLYEPDEDEQQPDVVECDRCQELNEPDAAFCMRCGFALDQETAAEVEEQADEKMKESYKQTDPEDTDTQEKLDTLDEILDDPEVKTALLEKLGEN